MSRAYTGMNDADMDKAQVGIASVWYEGNPCNMHLLDLAEKVKEGVAAAGMVGMRFNTIGVSDGISMGTEGMSYSLQSRDLIADSIETIMAGQWYDANVSIPGCDKNMPGCLIAMGRLHMLTAVLAGFGRTMSEVGAIILVGGNIAGYTRTMTTAIGLETSRGALPLADWLRVTVTPLASHPNDPAGQQRVRRDGQQPGVSRHLPGPRLTRVYRLEASVGRPLELGETATGRRRIVPLTGGTFSGPVGMAGCRFSEINCPALGPFCMPPIGTTGGAPASPELPDEG